MKIRTDFVTNSSSSSFTIEIGFFYRNGRYNMDNITTKYEGPGDIFLFHEVAGRVSAKEMGNCKSVEELIELLKNGFFGDEKPAYTKKSWKNGINDLIYELENNVNIVKLRKIYISGREVGWDNTSMEEYTYDILNKSYEKNTSQKQFVSSEGFSGELVSNDTDEATEVAEIEKPWNSDPYCETKLTDYLCDKNISLIGDNEIVVIPETVIMIDPDTFSS